MFYSPENRSEVGLRHASRKYSEEGKLKELYKSVSNIFGSSEESFSYTEKILHLDITRITPK